MRRATITHQNTTATATIESGHQSRSASLMPTMAKKRRPKPSAPARPSVGSANSATRRADASTTQIRTTAGSLATSTTAQP